MYRRNLTMLSSRSFEVILVKKFPAFQPQGACEARVQQSDDSKSWLEILDKSWAWLEILTRNSNSKGERMCSFSPLLEILTQNSTRNTNSRSASKIGQPSCAWLTKLYLVSILYFKRWMNKVINMKLLVSSALRPPHHQTISSPKESPSRIKYLIERKSHQKKILSFHFEFIMKWQYYPTFIGNAVGTFFNNSLLSTDANKVFEKSCTYRWKHVRKPMKLNR